MLYELSTSVRTPPPGGQPHRLHAETQIYNEQVVYLGAWDKILVVTREHDEAILNHALIQSRRRYRT